MVWAALLLMPRWAPGDTWKAVRELAYTNAQEEIAETHVESLRYVVTRVDEGKAEVRVERKLLETRFGAERLPSPQNVDPEVALASMDSAGKWTIPDLPHDRTYRMLAALFEALPGRVSEEQFESSRKGVLSLKGVRMSSTPTVAVFRFHFQEEDSDRPASGDGTFELRPADGQLTRCTLVASDVPLPGGRDRATLTLKYSLSRNDSGADR